MVEGGENSLPGMVGGGSTTLPYYPGMYGVCAAFSSLYPPGYTVTLYRLDCTSTLHSSGGAKRLWAQIYD